MAETWPNLDRLILDLRFSGGTSVLIGLAERRPRLVELEVGPEIDIWDLRDMRGRVCFPVLECLCLQWTNLRQLSFNIAADALVGGEVTKMIDDFNDCTQAC